MKIQLNGESVELSDAISLNSLIDRFDMNRETVVVELNGDLPDKSEYDSIVVNEGDRIELIRFVGGG
ncbi:thiamine biosynthesis protein ThiS [Denitrovibrio acetiphilus DSM 12809]|uniref:Thiamine biosynthesis protein ThiS n=1 Tax=Denitrovibrio acetiphilus (strain DSM 12809 / NBRC 114555 / N2460) TaxID=522772 RepID=D4H1A4_DENA2|nr:sulfur carrier protein ThiS [Denitrovibrio acetiphilus]ADD66852.1 thiamine biosynthesis protein ThiS [Denitrovibrio acetiphilus DSM 12809]